MLALGFDASAFAFTSLLALLTGKLEEAERALKRVAQLDPVTLSFLPLLAYPLADRIEVRIPWIDGKLQLLLSPPFDGLIARRITLGKLFAEACRSGVKIHLETRGGASDRVDSIVSRLHAVIAIPENCGKVIYNEKVHTKQLTAWVAGYRLIVTITANLTGPEIFKIRTGDNTVVYAIEPSKPT